MEAQSNKTQVKFLKDGGDIYLLDYRGKLILAPKEVHYPFRAVYYLCYIIFATINKLC